MPPQDERRRFARFDLDRTARIEAGGESHLCRLVDISLRGLLVTYCHDWQPVAGMRVEVHVALDDHASHTIDMSGLLAHVGPSRLGVRIIAMDLESSVKLRRLIEINLGDARALEREIEAMLDGA